MPGTPIARPEKRETGAGWNAEEDERDAGPRPVDQGEVLSLTPDLGKLLPFQAEVGLTRCSAGAEDGGDESRRRIGGEISRASQDLA